MAIDIVIPTYKNPHAIRRCLAALTANTVNQWSAIIMENGSHPLGWTKPTNKGVLAATAEVVVVMNDDCIPQLGWDIELCAAIKRGHWIACPYWEGHDFTGHCFAMSQEAKRNLFPLDERFIFWQSDALLLERLQSFCHSPVRVSSSVVLHDYSDPLRTSSRSELAQTIQQWITQDDQLAHS